MKRNAKTANKRTFSRSILDDLDLGDLERTGKRKRGQSFDGTENRKKKSAPSDCNYRRALPKVVSCNGTVVSNDFRSKVVSTTGTSKVQAMFSNHSVGPKGEMRNDLVDNMTRIILEQGRNATVLGCVAWVGGDAYIEALSQCLRTLLIVNREDYTSWGGGKMLEKFERLPRFDKPLHVAFSHLGSVLSTLEKGKKNGASGYKSVRAFGNPSSSPHGEGSRNKNDQGYEHCKYLIFFKKRRERDDCGNVVEREYPHAVMTGSANYTATSAKHHENCLYIENEEVAMGYFHDFANTFFASTTLASKNKNATPAKAAEKRATLVPGKGRR